MAAEQASFVDVGDTNTLAVPTKGELLSIAISGTYSMVIDLQRAVTPDRTAWETLKQWSTANATVAYSITTERENEVFRLLCRTDTSGTAVTTITTGDKELRREEDDDGNLLRAVSQAYDTGYKAQRDRGTSLPFEYMPAPQTATDTDTLTVAQVMGRLIVATPTAAAAYTLPTGAVLEAAMPADIAVGDSFDLTIINLGGTGDDITLTAPASGITLVGDLVVGPIADVATEQQSEGTWRFRRTAASTYIGYRIG